MFPTRYFSTNTGFYWPRDYWQDLPVAVVGIPVYALRVQMRLMPMLTLEI